MKKLMNITEIINMSVDEYDMECTEEAKKNPEYVQAQEKYEELIKTIDRKIGLEIDSQAVLMEALMMDAAFNGGFKLAVRLILSSAMS